MGRYIVARLIQSIPVLILVSVMSFGIMKLVPGDPAILIGGPTATPAELDNIRANLGLDQPFHIQMWKFYVGLVQGDLGNSLLLGKPVLQATIERVPVSLSIALYSMVLTLGFGIACGVVAALNRNGWIDQGAMVFALLGVSIPNFWLGLMFIILFSVHLGWLPTGGYVPWQESIGGWFATATMPAVSLALLQIGLLARITRSTMLEVLRQDYIRTAYAKGLRQRVVVVRHALRNALMPVVTVIGLQLANLLSGTLTIEIIFGLPGIGRVMIEAIQTRDYPTIQTVNLLVAASVVFINLAVDLTYGYLDPRTKVSA